MSFLTFMWLLFATGIYSRAQHIFLACQCFCLTSVPSCPDLKGGRWFIFVHGSVLVTWHSHKQQPVTSFVPSKSPWRAGFLVHRWSHTGKCKAVWNLMSLSLLPNSNTEQYIMYLYLNISVYFHKHEQVYSDTDETPFALWILVSWPSFPFHWPINT